MHTICLRICFLKKLPIMGMKTVIVACCWINLFDIMKFYDYKNLGTHFIYIWWTQLKTLATSPSAHPTNTRTHQTVWSTEPNTLATSPSANLTHVWQLISKCQQVLVNIPPVGSFLLNNLQICSTSIHALICRLGRQKVSKSWQK